MAKEFNNRQAYFNYSIEDKYLAGVVLLGSEVKSIRAGKVSFNDSFCLFFKGELWIRGLYIGEYSHAHANNHESVHDRKLLLKKKEIRKLEHTLDQKGYTLIPLKLFFNDKQFVKIEIGLGKGKKNHDKRESIKKREHEIEIRSFLKR
ncbi:MAG: SsrA-binding protein SmpB [Phycisphaerales bacterium]|nr:SsrA-binding protein SmpB [Phycisphaerales bacterium]